jgi:hypothetical protein
MLDRSRFFLAAPFLSLVRIDLSQGLWHDRPACP